MPPPNVIYVGPNDVPVKVKKRLSDDSLRGEFTDAGIHIDRKQSESGLRDTVLHEAMHAIIYLAGIKKALELDHDDEEKLVVTLTPWILALMRDNPALVEFLMENREREY